MKKVLALIVLCFIAFNSHAQLRYQNGYLVYNAMERYNGYMTNWEGWAHCWKFGDRMIKFDLGPADSRVFQQLRQTRTLRYGEWRFHRPVRP